VERNTKQNQGCKNIYVVNTVRLEEIRMLLPQMMKNMQIELEEKKNLGDVMI
jgi:hypothetical protein